MIRLVGSDNYFELNVAPPRPRSRWQVPGLSVATIYLYITATLTIIITVTSLLYYITSTLTITRLLYHITSTLTTTIRSTTSPATATRGPPFPTGPLYIYIYIYICIIIIMCIFICVDMYYIYV